MAGLIRRVIWRLKWRKCRHCGAPCHSFRIPKKRRAEIRVEYPDASAESRERLRGVHWAHVYGEAHCEAPCSRWRRCKCIPLCDECDEAHYPEEMCDAT